MAAVTPAGAWWSWPVALLAIAALAAEVVRVLRGDGTLYNQPLTEDELRAWPKDEPLDA